LLPLTDEEVVKICWFGASASLDVSCFLVNDNGKVPSDDYMIFYNQPNDPRRIIQYEDSSSNQILFRIQIQQFQVSGLKKCVFAATVDGPGTIQQFQELCLLVECGNERIRYDLTSFGQEKSLVIAEIYLHQNQPKIRAVGKGFHGGLKPLAEAHGVEVKENDDQSGKSFPVQTPPVNKLTKNENLPPRIDLLKMKVMISLEKNKIAGVVARVAIVIDASGSMSFLYSKGTVQRAFERMLAVATAMDDDGVLDVWFFGSRPMRALSVTAQEYENYVARTYPQPRFFGGLGIGNNEPLVMEDVVRKYTVEEPNQQIPTYVILLVTEEYTRVKKYRRFLLIVQKIISFGSLLASGMPITAY
jgi:stress response protein SCP2